MNLLKNCQLLGAVTPPTRKPGLLDLCRRLDYDPDQPREGNGQWAETGAGGKSGTAKPMQSLRGSGSTYWRIQNEGFALSQTHRSQTFSEDENDEGVTHKGTSAVESFKDLNRAQANINRTKPLEIIQFEGDEVERGWDKEPVVRPEKELRRWRAPAGVKLPPRISTVSDLVKAGFKPVDTLPVVKRGS